MVCHNEARQHVVAHGPRLFPEYPVLVAYDYLTEAGRFDLGRGDLVFSNAENSHFLVVQVRQNQPTASRNTKRQAGLKLRKRVAYYAESWAKWNPGSLVHARVCIDGVLGPVCGPFFVESEDGKPHFEGFAGHACCTPAGMKNKEARGIMHTGCPRCPLEK